MAACPLKRAKYLPSKWILHHDVAHFETELNFKERHVDVIGLIQSCIIKLL